MSVESPPAPPAMDPRIRARRVQVTMDEGRRRLRLLLVAAAVIAILGGTAGAVRSPLLDVDKVELVGAEHTQRAEVLRATGLDDAPQMVDVEPNRLASRVRALPWVRTAKVERHWPNQVSIAITERKPVAALSVKGGWLLVDGTGRVLSRADSPAPNMVTITAGPSAAPLRPGQELPAPLDRVTALVSSLPAEVLPLAHQVSLTKAAGLEMRSAAAGPVIRLGPADDLDDKVEAVRAVIAGVDLRRVAVIDVRVPSAPVLTRR